LPDENFIIEYVDGTTDYAKSVIYALGASYRRLPEKVTNNIPIHYCALCDGSLYKDKTVTIIGGGDVAFTQAEYLSKICTEVWIVMCDRNVTAAPSTFERVSKIDNIKIIYDYPIECIRKYEDGKYRLKREYTRDFGLPTEGIFVAIGMIPNTQSRIATSKIITDTLGYIMANENGKTAIDGFFAAGDVRAKSMRQSITAAADGAYAVNSVIAYLARRGN
jgi:thioredoxin reductase (NADPH)